MTIEIPRVKYAKTNWCHVYYKGDGYIICARDVDALLAGKVKNKRVNT